jgi:hypothetical protein
MAEEVLTVAQAAVELGVTIPRLRRLLGRPDLAHLSFPLERQTATGTRTARCVSVSLLPDIKMALEQERERERPDSFLSVRERNIYQVLLAEKDSRAADLLAALDQERATVRELLNALGREQALRSLPAPEEVNLPWWRRLFGDFWNKTRSG